MKITVELDEGLAQEALNSFDNYVQSIPGKKRLEVVAGANLLCVIAERISKQEKKAKQCICKAGIRFKNENCKALEHRL